MTLGELIRALKEMPSDGVITHGFGEPMSYRGYYGDLAFAPRINTTAGEMLAHAESAVGKTFTGYKGGEYTMSEHTDCWISEYGNCSYDGVSTQLVSYWAKEAAQ